MKLFEACVYTILDEDDLLRADRGREPSDPLSEGKPWSKVAGWLAEAKDRDERVAIVFADAKHVHRWLGWAVLTDDLSIDPPGQRQRTTRYRFQNLRPLHGHDRSEFVLLQTGDPLPASHIRPYVHFRTPEFLRREAEQENGLLLSEGRQQPLEETLVDLCGSVTVAQAIARVFAHAIRSVPNFATSEHWTINEPNGLLRLNVGMVEVLTMNSWGLAVVALPETLSETGREEIKRAGGEVESTRYKTVQRIAPGGLKISLPLVQVAQFERLLCANLEAYITRDTSTARSQHRHAFSVAAMRTIARMADDAELAKAVDNLDARQDELAKVEATIEPFDPLDERDGRERVLATLVRRRGQAEFRRELLRAYRSRCAISGCPVEDVLEAAHIKAYRGEHTNHVTNGLLLRADLHVLFDLYLIAIEPGSDSYSVIIDPGLASTPYGQFDGQKLLLPEARSQWPDLGCLRSRPRAWLPTEGRNIGDPM